MSGPVAEGPVPPERGPDEPIELPPGRSRRRRIVQGMTHFATVNQRDYPRPDPSRGQARPE